MNNTDHPLLAFVASYGLTEADILVAAANARPDSAFSLDRAIQVRMPEAKLLADAGLQGHDARVFTWSGNKKDRDWLLAIDSCSSAREGIRAVVHLVSVADTRALSLSAAGAIPEREVESKPPRGPKRGARVDQVLLSRPAFKERGISRPAVNGPGSSRPR